MRYSRFICIIFLALICSIPAAAARRTTCYTTYDDYFLYAAFEVPDSNVQSTNVDHMSKPWEDDSIEVFLETDGARGQDRTPHTYQMSVSAGGGSSWLTGVDGKAVPKTIYDFKYATRVEGTLNKAGDRDLGYIIELALPWQEMGGPPQPGTVMGFNFICHLKGDNDGFVSFSPDVKTEDDIQVPAKWGKIKFVNNPTIVAMDNGAIVCRKVLNRAPVIDGKFGPNEWNRDLNVTLALPEPKVMAVEAQQAKQSLGIEKLLLAKYYYWYSSKNYHLERRVGEMVIDDAAMCKDHPFDGMGPWVSYDNVQWHKDQLSAMAGNGIDVALPVYFADGSNRSKFGSPGLYAMSQAAKELKAEGRNCPMIGMYLDAEALASAVNEKPASSADDKKQVVYGAIRDFFLHIPDECRACVQLPSEKAGQTACVVAMSYSARLQGFDPEYCSNQFFNDFGRKLVFIGDSQYKAKSINLDGYTGDASKPASSYYDENGWIKTSQVSPVSEPRQARQLMADSYKKDWEGILAKSPDWVLLDSWNNFVTGTDVCPSKEYGYVYSDATKLESLAFNGMRPYVVKFLRHDTPTTMLPGEMYQVTLTIKNAGLKPWYPADGIFLAGRWYKDGAFYADSGARLPIQEKGLAGQVWSKTIGVRTIDQDAKPLPEGQYELRWDMMHGHDEWFADQGGLPLIVPVKIGTPAPGITIVSSTTPAFIKSDDKFVEGCSTTIKFRNDGPSPLGSSPFTNSIMPPVVQFSYRQVGTDGNSADIPATIAGLPVCPIVEPGRIGEVSWRWDYKLFGTKPSQEGMVSGIKWTLDSDKGPIGNVRNYIGLDTFGLVTADDGAKFAAADIPQEMHAGKKTPMTVTLMNIGAVYLMKSSNSVVCRWYDSDGKEVQGVESTADVPADIKPGAGMDIKLSIPAPQYDGRYTLAIGLSSGKELFTGPTTHGGDTLRAPIRIVKGKNK